MKIKLKKLQNNWKSSIIQLEEGVNIKKNNPKLNKEKSSAVVKSVQKIKKDSLLNKELSVEDLMFGRNQPSSYKCWVK